jgi:hypothetical protein
VYVFVLAGLFALRSLARLIGRALPFLVTAACGLLFLPMVLLGGAGLAVWRRRGALAAAAPGGASSSRRNALRRWLQPHRSLVLLALLAALQYGAAALLLRADPLLLYLLVHLTTLSAVVLALLGDPVWTSWQPATYLLALPAVLPGSLVAAGAIARWPRPWRRRGRLGVSEPAGLDVPVRVAARALAGVTAPAGGWALGYRPDGRVVTIGDAESRHHTLICGTPGAGKTTVLNLILDGVAGRCPVVVVDGKASSALRQAVAAIPGSVIWTIGGAVRWDALRGDPTSFSNKLLAAERYTADAAVYEASAGRYLQAVGQLLALEDHPRDPLLVRDLLQPPALRAHIRQLRLRHGAARHPVIDPIERFVVGMGRAEHEGVAGFAARFGRFVEGTAGAGLGAGPDALVLEAAIRAGRTVLFSLDAAAFPLDAAKVGAWVIHDLLAVAGRLQEESWSVPGGRQAYVLVDELTSLVHEGEHVKALLTRGREAGFGCVVATQSLADLDRIDTRFGQQVLQNTAVKIVLRQGSAADAESWSRQLGHFEREVLSRQVDDDGRSLGRNSARWERAPYVAPGALRALGTGDAVLSVVPLGDRPGRLERLRVARPAPARSGARG